MKKNIYLLLLAIISFAGNSIGQTVNPCKTSEVRLRNLQQYPEISKYEEQLEKGVKDFISSKALSGKLSRKTASDTTWYDIPVVVHVIHDYGNELLADNKIYELIAEMNRFYSLQNNVSTVVPEFKKYIGNAHMRFHLATKDPNGQPTKGITHRQSYLTYGGDDHAKFDQWNPASYVNIWFINVIGKSADGAITVAYATPPSTAAAAPYRDGIISNYAYLLDGVGKTDATGGSIDHEMGHIMNLAHTFGSAGPPGTNKPGACVSDDGVDDTPPTDGNLGGCKLKDTICSSNNFKVYTAKLPSKGGADSLEDFPDFANEQNIMNYADCKVMLTQGQVDRMHAALNNDIGYRDSLWTANNLSVTGALAPMPDLPAIPDYSIKNPAKKDNIRFTCPGTNVQFVNASWRDTIERITWTFGNEPTIATATATATGVGGVVPTTPNATLTNSFNAPGWTSVTLSAKGNNSAEATTTFPRALYIAEKDAVKADGYFMEFNNADTALWPMFNYYDNEFKWQYANVGYYDNSSIEFVGFDSRSFPANIPGVPLGDYDDIFSRPMDLSAFTGTPCKLNYFYSSTSRTTNFFDINEALVIDYSIDRATTWKRLDSVTKGRMVNNGALNTSYTPSGMTDWAPMSIDVPAAARTPYTVFRFRYRPGVSLDKFPPVTSPPTAPSMDISAEGSSFTTGNNFFMDRIYFSQWPAAVDNTQMSAMDVKVVPNPTSGDAYVMIKDVNSKSAKVIVSDITGKQVYTVSEQIYGNQANIQIPREAISVKGIYMVQTITGSQTHTQKLVVY